MSIYPDDLQTARLCAGRGENPSQPLQEPALPQPIRILLVEDHEFLRQALHLLLEQKGSFNVIGEAKNRIWALVLAAREQPDIILLDVELENYHWHDNSLDFLPYLLSLSLCHVVILTGHDDPELHERAKQLGAQAVLLKTQPTKDIIDCIERVSQGEAPRGLVSGQAPKIGQLTEQECEIISMLCASWENQKIAESLGLNKNEVQCHINGALSTLEVADVVELVIYAYRNGLASPSRQSDLK